MKQFFKKITVAIIMWEAKQVLKKHKPKIIAITGSVGKTSTKDAIYAALAGSYFVRKSQKSFNSEVGVPLTILGLPNGWSNPFVWTSNFLKGFWLCVFPSKYPKWLVLEVGADRPNDIRRIAEWLSPDIVVITRFSDVPVHVEYFSSVEDLVSEKMSLALGLKPGGVLITNNDDTRIVQAISDMPVQKVSFGLTMGADILAQNDHITYGTYDESDLELPWGEQFDLVAGGQTHSVTLTGSLGYQHIYPVLAAYAVAVNCGIKPDVAVAAFKEYQTPPGRMKLLSGIHDTLVIDDSYNSSPIAVQEGFSVLSKIKTSGRKIAVLGDMLELGDFSLEAHRQIGELAAKTINILVVVGVRSRATADAALDAGLAEDFILEFDGSREAGKYVNEFLKTGDVIFVKGSQSMRMERVVEEIMEHREDKENLLVRQDSKWQSKE